MNLLLVSSAFLMGLAGSAHCTAMCGAASTLAVRACSAHRSLKNWAGFLAGRALGYAAAGTLAASSVEVLQRLGSLSATFRPLWTAAHLAAFGLGWWLVINGRQPTWFERNQDRQADHRKDGAATVSWFARSGPSRATLLGSLWWLWPCGLLQSALIVAALAGTPLGGGLIMVTFAVASSLGLTVFPGLLRKHGLDVTHQSSKIGAWVTRLSGLMLVAASTWALGHGLWNQLLAYCRT